MPHRTHRPTTTAIRTGLVRWYAVFALLWIAVTISTVWLSGPRLNLGYLIWLPLVAGFVALSGLGMRRILNQVERLDDENDDLRAAYDRVRVDALLDGLTGLGNHRAFQEELELRVTTVEADSASFVLMVLDVDDLKLVNEVEGHAAGDELLRATAKIITSALRRFDRGFRIGGDEFALVLRECDADEGVAGRDEQRRAVGTAPCEVGGAAAGQE